MATSKLCNDPPTQSVPPARSGLQPLVAAEANWTLIKGPLSRWFGRRHPPVNGPVTLVGSRVYILPTAQGWLFAALLLVLFLGSLNYANSLAFALTFLLAGVGLVGIWHTQRNLVGLTVTLEAPLPAFAGGEVRFPVRLEAENGKPHYSVRLAFPEAAAEPVLVAANAASETDLRLPARHRGRLDPGVLKVSSRYPLGLFEAWSWVNIPLCVPVYPAPAGNPTLPCTRNDRPHAGSGRGRAEEEFDGLRPYRSGDPLRRVAWKASTRGAGLQTKVFAGGSGDRLWLGWPAGVGEPESALSQLCLWVLVASRDGLEFGMRLGDQVIGPGRGTHHQRQCLELLACHEVNR